MEFRTKLYVEFLLILNILFFEFITGNLFLKYKSWQYRFLNHKSQYESGFKRGVRIPLSPQPKCPSEKKGILFCAQSKTCFGDLSAK